MGQRCPTPSLPAPSVVLLFLFLLLSFLPPQVLSQGDYSPPHMYLIDCGSLRNTTVDNRVWQRDTNSGFVSTSQEILANTSSVSNSTEALLQTARIFTSESRYTFSVSQGRSWIRLYFYPISYQGYNSSSARFSVVADKYTLISNINVVDAVKSSKLSYLLKEYSINVTSGTLSISFIPSDAKSFAFINALEVTSMPSNIIDDDASPLGPNFPMSIGMPYMALESMYRVNVGGPSVTPANDSAGLYRFWEPNESHLSSPAVVAQVNISNSKNAITYPPPVPSYLAPTIVYTTALQLGDSQTAVTIANMSWIFPVDAEFLYVVRLHFCELLYTSGGYRIFDVYLQNQTAISHLDLALTYTAFNVHFSDILVNTTGGVSSIRIDIGPTPNAGASNNNAILNGIEVWKVNNSVGSLDALYAAVVTSSSGSKNVVGPILGAAVGGTLVMGLLLAGFCIFCRKRSKVIKQSPPTWLPLPMHGGNSVSMVSKVSTGSHKSGTGSYVSSAPSSLGRFFTFAEIQEATNNFDEASLLGVGGFGKVYKGELDDGTKVAVKRGNPRSEQGLTEFQTEIEMLSKLRHRHLVSLIGYCEEHSEMILVYECMANGPLRSHLYGYDLPPLSWRQRLEICIGAARGLHYLHTGAAQGIIHRDVKTTNILLDETFVAKVSDFGLSKTGPTLDRTHVSTAVKGSFGYLDPEYFRRQQLTEKSDVYSFGVVLMEVLCARPAINPALPRDQVNIAEWAMHWQKMGRLDQIIDPHLAGTVNMESLRKFGETAEKCLAEQGIDRPAMGDVLWNLEYALQLQETATSNDVDEDSINRILELPVRITAQEQWDASGVENHSMVSEEDSEDATSSAVFSQLVNPQGR